MKFNYISVNFDDIYENVYIVLYWFSRIIHYVVQFEQTVFSVKTFCLSCLSIYVTGSHLHYAIVMSHIINNSNAKTARAVAVTYVCTNLQLQAATAIIVQIESPEQCSLHLSFFLK